MAKFKYSKMKHFKLVTGKHLLSLTEDVTGDDVEVRMEALETLALGLTLLEHANPFEARREYERLIKAENEEERYSLIDNVDVEELLDDVIQ